MYPNEVIFDLFCIFGKCDKIVERTCREFNQKYPQWPKMTRNKFAKIRRNFLNNGSWKTELRRTKEVVDREETVINVLGYFNAYPKSSIRGAVAELGVSYASVRRILVKHNMRPYKFTLVQHLIPADFPRRINFCEFLLVKIQENPDFLKNVIWTDEAKFDREGLFNTHNRHFWADTNPRMVQERGFQNKFSINVFCLLRNNELRFITYRETLNSARYVMIINDFVGEYLDNLPLADLRSLWYQLDGAPAHCTHDVAAILTNLFDDRWIRRLGPWDWPARSPDLTPLDFFLWGVIKNKVYNGESINNVDELEQKINQAFDEIRPQQIEDAVMSVENRLIKCLDANGMQFEHLM